MTLSIATPLSLSVDLSAISETSVLEERFSVWCASFNKTYESADERTRAVTAFAYNARIVEEMNANEPFKPFGAHAAAMRSEREGEGERERERDHERRPFDVFSVLS